MVTYFQSGRQVQVTEKQSLKSKPVPGKKKWKINFCITGFLLNIPSEWMFQYRLSLNVFKPLARKHVKKCPLLPETPVITQVEVIVYYIIIAPELEAELWR
jgi:hypothetical protein